MKNMRLKYGSLKYLSFDNMPVMISQEEELMPIPDSMVLDLDLKFAG